MNTRDPQLLALRRLHQAAKAGEGEAAPTLPSGFATRVVALAFSEKKASPSFKELLAGFSLKAVLMSCLLVLLSVSYSYPLLNAEPDADELPDPVSDLIAINF